MRELETLLASRDIEFDARNNRVMCYPHIINICASHIISSVTQASDGKGGNNGNDTADSDDDSDSNDDLADPIKQARTIVRALRASDGRRKGFLQTIRSGNDMGWFKVNEKVLKLPELQLLRDVKTRWDSVYHMLRRLRELRPVSLLFSCKSKSLIFRL